MIIAPKKLGMALVFLAGTAGAAIAQSYDGQANVNSTLTVPGLVDPQSAAQYQDQLQQYQDQQDTYQRQEQSYQHAAAAATASRDVYDVRATRWAREREAYERARADYDSRYGDGAWESRYGYGAHRGDRR
jgi:hypothetical protein